MKKNLYYEHFPSSRWKRIKMIMRLKVFLLLCCIGSLSANPIFSQTQTIDVSFENESILKVIQTLDSMPNVNLFYQKHIIDDSRRISLNMQDVTLDAVLDIVLTPNGLSYYMENDVIVIMPTPEPIVNANTQEPSKRLTGKVRDTDGNLMTGVTVLLGGNSYVGTSTDVNGEFSIDGSVGDVLIFSFIGYRTIEVQVRSAVIDVVMEEESETIDQVVVTGIVNRDFSTYTGSATTITAAELQRGGNQNVFQSLRNLDPSLFVMDNLAAGSDPNAMPEMIMRGTTSFPYDNTVNGIQLKGNYQNTSNMPLFILDGFETNVERVMDMDMTRIESVTILKDASAKALYGSKAANGVVVIETKSLGDGGQIVTYTGSVDITMPDLTSYNLTNAAEKLEAERIDGMYDGGTFINGALELKQLYMERLKLVNDGLDTYWLSKPLRVGVGHKHNLNVELGDTRSLYAIADVTYNNIAGVMKGSKRNSIAGNINLSYRTKTITFRNIMSITSLNSEDSPWGRFGEYTKMNPYWQAEDPVTGKTLRYAGQAMNIGNLIGNPMYDALIGTKYTESYLEFANNFYAEMNVSNALKVVARIGLSAKRNDGEEFLPSLHSKYSGPPYTDTEYQDKRGSYRLDNGKGSTYSGELIATYYKEFGKHLVFANGAFQIMENQFQAYANTAEGFPSDKGADITFARRYAEGTRPIGTSALTRESSALGTANYSYDNRYYADLTLRYTASSLFGRDNRWNPGWSVGLGWNLHNESFLKNTETIDMLKLRMSYGLTGNQNFNTNEAVGTYLFYSENDALYNGNTGAYLSRLPNPWLSMESTKDFNVGLDAEINGISLKLDVYNSLTENMITNITTSMTTGFPTMKENLGLIRNTGLEASLSVPIIRHSDGFLTAFGSVATNSNKIVRLSDSMKEYNRRQEDVAADRGNSKPVLIYRDGESMNTIWVVPSLGIDPMTGQEMYVKQDGTMAYTYDVLDLRPMGNSMPKFNGIFGFTAEYKGFGLSTSFRFLGGGQLYNEALIARVENVDMNYNVDRRVFLGRWKEPGQNAQFKRLGTFQYAGDPIAYQEMTRATSRFLQDRNELTWGALSAYYDFRPSLLEKLDLQRVRISFYMNDIYTFSSVRVERGLDYPFARTMSLALSVTF